MVLPQGALPLTACLESPRQWREVNSSASSEGGLVVELGYPMWWHCPREHVFPPVLLCAHCLLLLQVQIDPYLEDSMCQVCSTQAGPFFCRDQVRLCLLL